MIRMIMHGCNGAMGQTISKIVEKDPEIQIVAGIDPHSVQNNDYPVFASLSECDKNADVIVDFAAAVAVDGLLDYCCDKKMPIVLCTTGLSEEQLKHVKEASKKTAVLRSANMSLGVNLLLKFVNEAAAVLYPSGFDIEVVEKHHNQKVDAPSGTALALADAAKDALDVDAHYVYDRSKERKKREKEEIGIVSVRGGNIVGEHDVIFAGMDEVITFRHTAYSKAIFGKGAVSAAKFLAGKGAGLYQMSDVIG